MIKYSDLTDYEKSIINNVVIPEIRGLGKGIELYGIVYSKLIDDCFNNNKGDAYARHKCQENSGQQQRKIIDFLDQNDFIRDNKVLFDGWELHKVGTIEKFYEVPTIYPDGYLPHYKLCDDILKCLNTPDMAWSNLDNTLLIEPDTQIISCLKEMEGKGYIDRDVSYSPKRSKITVLGSRFFSLDGGYYGELARASKEPILPIQIDARTYNNSNGNMNFDSEIHNQLASRLSENARQTSRNIKEGTKTLNGNPEAFIFKHKEWIIALVVLILSIIAHKFGWL